MKLRHRVLLALAMCHLGLVLAGSLGWKPESTGTTAGEVLGCYATLSGANNRYSFYAPAVSTGMRATFTLTDRQGQTWTDTLGQGKTGEANLRLDTLVSMTGSEGWQTLLPRAWATSLLSRHPDASEVAIQIDYRELPPMRDWQRGATARWHSMLNAVYSCDAPTSEAKHDRDMD